MKFLTHTMLMAAASMICSAAFAKLPPPSPEAAAKAAEAAARTAWAGKVENYKLCQWQDRVAAHYRKTTSDAKPAVSTAPCADPGPFAYTPPAPAPAPAAAPAVAPGAPAGAVSPTTAASKS